MTLPRNDEHVRKQTSQVRIRTTAMYCVLRELVSPLLHTIRRPDTASVQIFTNLTFWYLFP